MNLPQFNPDALTRFKGLHKAPSIQGPIGRRPVDFLRLLRRAGAKRLLGSKPVEDLFPSVLGRCCRNEVRRISTDPRVDPLEAYAVAMAWGGQRKKHFEWSIREPALVDLLNGLRCSKRERGVDFGHARQLSRGIAGLGPSYWTKLLFFFRPDPNAYILDQWTGKSTAVLLPGVVRLIGHLPSPRTTEDEYEAYCLAIESLAAELGKDWSPGDAEQALFDRKRGAWRQWIKESFATEARSKVAASSSRDIKRSESISLLLDAIAAEHHSSVAAGMPLPSGLLRRSSSDSRRVRIGGERGERSSDVMWYYRVTTKRASVGVHFSKGAIHLLDSLAASNDQAPWFGGARTSVATRTIELDLPLNPRSGEKDSAAILVAAMSSLFAVVHAISRLAGIQHPKL